MRGAKTAEKIGSCANSRNETGNGVQNVRGLDVPGRVAATKPRAIFFCGSQDALSRGKMAPGAKGAPKRRAKRSTKRVPKGAPSERARARAKRARQDFAPCRNP